MIDFGVVDIVDIVDIVDFGWIIENLWKRVDIYFSLFKVYYSPDNWREREIVIVIREILVIIIIII